MSLARYTTEVIGEAVVVWEVEVRASAIVAKALGDTKAGVVSTVVREAVKVGAFVDLITEVGEEAALVLEVAGESVLLVTAVVGDAVDAEVFVSELTVVPVSVLVFWEVEV